MPPMSQTAMLEAVTQSSSAMSISSVVTPSTPQGYVPHSGGAFDHVAYPVVPTGPHGFPELLYNAPSSDDSLFSSSDSCYSPNSEYPRAHIAGQPYLPMHQRQRSSSITSLVDPYFQPQMMKTPLCSTSTLPTWTEIETSLPPQELVGANQFEGAFLQPVGTPHLGRPLNERWAHSFLGTSHPIPLSELDGHEWAALRRVLFTAAGVAVDRSGVVDASTLNIEDYLDCYWRHFSPLFPVIHRPTFCVNTPPPPLLSAAMVAIGAQFSTRPQAKNYSTFMHEACMKLLTTVSDLPHYSFLVHVLR